MRRGETMIRKLLVLTIAAAPVMAETRVSLIGGGNTLDDSQAQIESNVGWLQTIFREREIETRTYFGAGDTEEPDVAYLAPTELASRRQGRTGGRAARVVSPASSCRTWRARRASRS